MSIHLTPYIAFDGNAREALDFYHDVFGGELTSNTFGEFGQAGTPIENLIMHGQIDSAAGFRLMASDTPPGMDRHPGRTVTLTLHGDDEATMRGYWDRLVDGGTVDVALDTQMWGDIYGQLQDKFGILWMFNIVKG